MDADRDLERLAEMAGVEPRFWDIFGGYHETTPEGMRAILGAMGFDARSDDGVRASLRMLENGPWQSVLPPVKVFRLGPAEGRFGVPISIPDQDASRPFRWRLVCDNGVLFEDEFRPADAPPIDNRTVDGIGYSRYVIDLPSRIAPGYQRLRLEGADTLSESTIIVAPERCYLPESFDRNERIWGLGTHLYALRSASNWGNGDFGTLTRFVDASATLGADFVGINPLHATMLRQPSIPSPYSPSSRVFLNPLYLDVTAVPEFAGLDEVALRIPVVAAALREKNHVDYEGIVEFKLGILRHLHAAFETQNPSGETPSDRRSTFERFRAERGSALERYAIYQGLKNQFKGGPWQRWPEEFRNPDSPAVQRFAKDNADEVSYHTYIQWLLDSQLAEVAQRAETKGMGIGLYGDLAVGVEPGGADAWANQGVVVGAMRFGAPPDAFNAQGQNWGNPPTHPLALRDQAYAPFADILRANMRYFGGVRIDHAMSLMRLYWIPDGASPMDGAYVRYPMDDLLGVVALESVRNRCVVIGEDLGTVPDGFRDRMAEEAILSYRVFYFERYPNGLYKRPEIYPELAIATATTHDLPTIAGHWMGRDLEWRNKLGLSESPESAAAEAAERARDRELLIAALDDQGTLRPDFPQCPEATSDDQVFGLTSAVERFLARSPALLTMVNLDDVFCESDQLNMPGTTDSYPNWRRKLSVPVESIASDPKVRAICRAVADERRRPLDPDD